MNETFLLLIGCISGSLVTWLTFRELHKTRDSKLVIASQELVTLLNSQLEEMSNLCASLTDERDQARREAEKQRGWAELHISKNSAFDAQARKAWEVYKEHGLAAGNAQAWLFRELENAVRMINRYRAKNGEPEITVNPKLVEMLSEIKRDIDSNVEKYAP